MPFINLENLVRLYPLLLGTLVFIVARLGYQQQAKQLDRQRMDKRHMFRFEFTSQELKELKGKEDKTSSDIEYRNTIQMAHDASVTYLINMEKSPEELEKILEKQSKLYNK